MDPEAFCKVMCDLVSPNEIISLRQLPKMWLLEFAGSKAAQTIASRFNGLPINGKSLFTELVDQKHQEPSKADFDFELRCFCIANYCDPPIFIYGRVVSYTQTQVCSVIIKDNRKNAFRTIFIEMSGEELIDIHSRVCEAVYLFLMEMKEFPKKNLVMKCTKSMAWIGELWV